MNREITDIYKKDFFLDFGKQISQTHADGVQRAFHFLGFLAG